MSYNRDKSETSQKCGCAGLAPIFIITITQKRIHFLKSKEEICGRKYLSS